MWIMFRLEGADHGTYRLRINGHERADLVMVRSGAYDRGFYNIGVRPTAEDLGVGGTPGWRPAALVDALPSGRMAAA